MINLLILYELNKKVLTMYGITESIKSEFSALMIPSIGTIKPALKKMELCGFVTTQKYMSKGGRPSTCYAITEPGKVALRGELLSPISENPIQFLTNARIRLYCAEILNYKDLPELLNMLKKKTEILMKETRNILKDDNITFYPKMVFDNITCEYENFYSLLEGIEHACKH